MAKRNYKYNNTVDLSNLPVTTSRKYIDWKNSVGCIIPFTFDNNKLCGEFEIIDYKIPEGLSHPHIYLKYQNVELKPILPISLKNATISNILDEFYIEWVYEIGENIKDENRDLTVIDRKRKHDNKNGYLTKYYKVKCNKCGFNSSEHYMLGEKRDELWIAENDLNRIGSKRYNCSCCSNKIVVPGINDIPTTNPWMVDYFQGGYDEAKRYTYGSNIKKNFKCIFCGEINTKPISIQELYHLKGIPCICKDNMSYPNKFAYYTFKQLEPFYDYYCNEFCPKWAGLYKYDNYVEIGENNIIFEMDGGVGHGNKQYKSTEQDIDGIKRDKIKDCLAKEHNIIIERVDCLYSEFYYIKPRFEKILSKYFNTEVIDWDLVEANCRNTNLYKEICERYNNSGLLQKELAEEFNVGRKVIMSALKTGNVFGWCDYIPHNQKDELLLKKVIELWNTKKYTFSQIGKIVNKSASTVKRIIQDCSKEGLCEYDNTISTTIYHNSRKKPIYVYDKNINLLAKYSCAYECVENSLKDFGVKFTQRSINNVACHNIKTHKGYIFSYTLLQKNDKKLYSNNHESVFKKVYVYDSKMKFCGVYNSRKELGEKSLNDFGVKFIPANISMVCNGKYKQHKGYYFSNTPIKENYSSDNYLLLCSNL